MGYDVGACGAYGILISGYEDKLGKLYVEFTDAAAVAMVKREEDGFDDVIDFLADLYSNRFISAFIKIGIKVPAAARLQWTGTDEERPGRCETPPNDWVLGFGTFTNPNLYPKMDKSFIKESQWWTWVWGG